MVDSEQSGQRRTGGAKRTITPDRILAAVVCALLAGCAGKVPSTSPHPAAAGSSDACIVGSVDYTPTARPLTVPYRLAHIPRNAAIAIVDLRGPAPARYATVDGTRPSLNDGTTFDIYTPWDITVVKQLAGSQPTRIFADGGVIGCDRLSGAPTWSLAAGTRAVVVTLPTADRPTPAGWQALMWTRQVVGDRVLLPQPADTVGTGFDAISVDGVTYNGQTVPGSSISVLALETYLAKNF